MLQRGSHGIRQSLEAMELRSRWLSAFQLVHVYGREAVTHAAGSPLHVAEMTQRKGKSQYAWLANAQEL